MLHHIQFEWMYVKSKSKVKIISTFYPYPLRKLLSATKDSAQCLWGWFEIFQRIASFKSMKIIDGHNIPIPLNLQLEDFLHETGLHTTEKTTQDSSALYCFLRLCKVSGLKIFIWSTQKTGMQFASKAEVVFNIFEYEENCDSFLNVVF